LHEEFEAQGLTVLGVTDNKEDRGKTEAWVKELGVEYPYAYAIDGALATATERPGFPHAALINPKGVLVWTGHPSDLTKGLIEEHIKGASKFISYGWSEEFQPVAKAVGKREFAKAVAEADKLAAKGVAAAADVKTAVLGMLDAELATMNKALEGGDFYAANVVASALDGKLKGLTQEAAVETVLTRLATDKQAKEILDGQTKLQKIAQGELRKEKQLQDAIQRAEQLAGKYQGTIVETQAKEFVTKLRAQLAGK
jgi:hypothetical protein